MVSNEELDDDHGFDKRVMRAAVRLSLLALLVFWCLEILGPFINPILGGVVIAIAVQTPFNKLRSTGPRFNGIRSNRLHSNGPRSTGANFIGPRSIFILKL